MASEERRTSSGRLVKYCGALGAGLMAVSGALQIAVPLVPASTSAGLGWLGGACVASSLLLSMRRSLRLASSTWRSQQASAQRQARLGERIDSHAAAVSAEAKAIAARVDRAASTAADVRRSVEALSPNSADPAAPVRPGAGLEEIEMLVTAAAHGVPVAWARALDELLAVDGAVVAVLARAEVVAGLRATIDPACADRVTWLPTDRGVHARSALRAHALTGVLMVLDDVAAPDAAPLHREWFAWLPIAARIVACTTGSSARTLADLAVLEAALGLGLGARSAGRGTCDVVVLLDREEDA